MSDLANLFVWRHDRVVVAGVTGEIDVSNAAQLESAIAGELGRDTAGLVVDLAGLEFMDSSGVHLLFGLARRLAQRGLGFALVLPADRLPRRVLELSGPQPGRWMHTTEEAAIAAVLARP
jgi:anti-anti-sigma factor